MGFEVGDTQKLEAQYETLSSKLTTLRKKQADLNKTDLSQVTKSIDKIGESASGVIKKIGRWVLAVFAVESAYGAVRTAMSTLQQYDAGIKANITYIQYAIANALKPLIEGLINLAFKLLTYVGYIAKAWFGVNIFANSSANAFKNANKQAEKLKKTTAGFDELNVVSSGATGTATATATPSYDLSSMQGEYPFLIKWIAENGDLVKNILIGIGAIIATMKIAKFIVSLSKMAEGLQKIFKADKLLKAVGIGLMIAGIVLLITNIYNLITNWENLSAKEKIISAMLIVLGAGFIALGYAIATGISVATLGIGAIIAAITTAVVAIGVFIARLVTEKDAILSVKDAKEKLKKAQEELTTANDSYIDSIDRAEEAQRKLNEAEKIAGMTGKELNDLVEKGNLNYQEMNTQQRELYKAYLENDKAQKNMKESTDLLTDAKKKEKTASWDNKLAISNEKGEYDKYKNAVVDAFNKGELSADEARTAIEKSMSRMSRASQKAFTEDLPNDIKNGLDPKRYETMGQKLGKWFEGVFSSIGKGWNKFWSGVGDWFSGKSSTPKMATGGIVIPKLATGGLINYPNHGIPVGGGRAIGGEAGAEGIIPLTDSQAMATLGEYIGKYVNIENVINNYMDSRKISRIMASSNNRSSLASNG